ncbi:MAG: acetyl-CoA carboxylase biotin carboxyl carrier protein subunit [Desulfobacteraceae bacterium]|nr:MAG: acetyl-CoA carboxylase biotin carboxyl carrier protein subunit [Desulfobacteraceae bacterium]
MARVNVNGTDYDVRVETYPDAEAAPAGTIAPKPAAPKRTPAAMPPPAVAITPISAVEPVSGGNIVAAPMPGLILDVKVKIGDLVTAGQTVLIMEAMKMENRITVKISGTVKEIHVQKGSEVMSGAPLIVIS